MRTDRGAGDDTLLVAAAPGIRAVAYGGSTVSYLTGTPFDADVVPGAPDAVVVGEPTAAALDGLTRFDAPAYGPSGRDGSDPGRLAPGEPVSVDGLTVAACPSDEEALALAVRAGGVAAVFTPDAALDSGAEKRVARRAAAFLVDEPTRFHDHHRLHAAVNVLDVPRVAGESRLVDDALRADCYLLDDRDFGAEVGRQLADAGVSAETTRLASLLGPEGNGVTTIRHDAPTEVGVVRAASRNGFVVETERDLPGFDAPTVRAVSQTLVARGPRAEGGDGDDGEPADDAMEPDGRYDPDGDLDGG
ncbi:MAG: hypothetical protein ABEJ43_06690 [Haloferacaceae archaeon]